MPRRATWSRRRARRSGTEGCRGRPPRRQVRRHAPAKSRLRTLLSAATSIHYDTSIVGFAFDPIARIRGEISNMKKVLLAGCAALALAANPAVAQQKTVK